MRAIKFDEANLKLLAGDNPDTYDMPAARAVHQNGTSHVIGKFKLDANEVKRVIATGEIWVCIMGTQWPPILPTVLHPFKELGFKQPNKRIEETKYREQIDTMLRRLFFDANYMADSFDFGTLEDKLDRGAESGQTIEEQLKEIERVMTKIVQKDQLVNLARGN